MKILVIFAHPDVDNGSIGNKIILDRLNKVDGVAIRELYKMYPDFKMSPEDVVVEQQALIEADLIIFQFPLYWYNMPPLMRMWEDEVLLYGFCIGSKGDKLKGKDFLVSTTIGGPEESYSSTGYNSFTVPEFLRPIEQVAYHTGMNWLEPIYTHNVVNLPGLVASNEMNHSSTQGAIDQADRLIKVIEKKLADIAEET